MAESALSAAYEMLHQQLSGDVWGDRAYPDVVPAGVVRPYVVWFWVSGGEDNNRQIQDASFVFTVKCVANTMAESLAGAQRISELLNDHGTQDDSALPDVSPDWEITTVTQDRAVHLVEYQDGEPIYHDGNQYLIVMEAK